MWRTRQGAHARAMFPFTSFEATRMLVDDHIAELRRTSPTRHRTAKGRRRRGRADADTRTAR